MLLLVFRQEVGQDFLICRCEGPGRIGLYKMELERIHRCCAVTGVIADDAECLHGVEVGRYLGEGGIVPVAKTFGGQFMPGKIPVGVHFAARSMSA